MALTQVQGGMILASGQSIPKAALPTGSVLQVVNAAYSTPTSTSTNTFVDIGLSATITPTSASSKILALMSINGIAKESNDTYVVLRLVRGSTSISVFNRGGGWTAGNGSSGVGASAGVYLDSPATTSATTYKVQLASGANNAVVYANVGLGGSNGESTITLMEIAG